MYDMPSGPVADEFLVCLMAAMVMAGVKGGSMFGSVCNLCNCLSILLLSGCCGSWQVFA